MLKPNIFQHLRPATVRPSCTHVCMDKAHRQARCDICHEVPMLGWLYVCQQDCVQGALHWQNQSPHAQDTYSDTIRELKELGLSRSILNQAEEGRYTPDQLDLLKQQKKCVNKVIESLLAASRGGSDDDVANPNLHPNITIRKKSTSVLSGKSRPASRRGPADFANAQCSLKCCHVRK
jgi:hypothetical protein